MATDLETASERDTASVEMLEPTAAGRSRAPELALVLVVVGSFALYTLLALAVGVPRVHPDEVRYLIAASSLVEGEGLTLRGADYGFGPAAGGRARGDPLARGERRRCLRLVQGRERALLRPDGRARVPARTAGS